MTYEFINGVPVSALAKPIHISVDNWKHHPCSNGSGLLVTSENISFFFWLFIERLTEHKKHSKEEE
jgi:hypothetical protein